MPILDRLCAMAGVAFLLIGLALAVYACRAERASADPVEYLRSSDLARS